MKRTAAPTPPGEVPRGTWWSPLEVKVAGNRWCPEPPSYAAQKPPLPYVALPSGWKATEHIPKLTREFVFKHASPKNFIIATYINFKRLDFAFTMVRHLIALGQPHYIVGAMDLPALEGLMTHGIPAFYIDSGLTTEDYGWGTPNFRKMGLHKVQLVLDLAKLGVDALTVDVFKLPPKHVAVLCCRIYEPPSSVPSRDCAFGSRLEAEIGRCLHPSRRVAVRQALPAS